MRAMTALSKKRCDLRLVPGLFGRNQQNYLDAPNGSFSWVSDLRASDDALVRGGAARWAFHGIGRIMTGTSMLLPEAGRIGLTLRRATRPTT